MEPAPGSDAASEAADAVAALEGLLDDDLDALEAALGDAPTDTRTDGASREMEELQPAPAAAAAPSRQLEPEPEPEPEPELQPTTGSRCGSPTAEHMEQLEAELTALEAENAAADEGAAEGHAREGGAEALAREATAAAPLTEEELAEEESRRSRPAGIDAAPLPPVLSPDSLQSRVAVQDLSAANAHDVSQVQSGLEVQHAISDQRYADKVAAKRKERGLTMGNFARE